MGREWLTADNMEIIRLVADHGPLTSRGVLDLIEGYRSAPSNHQMINRLVEKGVLEQVPGSRVSTYQLTTMGTELNDEHGAWGEKRCGSCGLVKPLAEFSRNRSMSDGHQGWCKECAREYKLVHKEKKENPSPYQKPTAPTPVPKRYATKARKLGMSLQSLVLLHMIAVNGPTTLGELRALTGNSLNVEQTRVEDLQESGLVRRDLDASRVRYAFSATKKGIDLLDEARLSGLDLLGTDDPERVEEEEEEPATRTTPDKDDRMRTIDMCLTPEQIDTLSALKGGPASLHAIAARTGKTTNAETPRLERLVVRGLVSKSFRNGYAVFSANTEEVKAVAAGLMALLEGLVDPTKVPPFELPTQAGIEFYATRDGREERFATYSTGSDHVYISGSLVVTAEDMRQNWSSFRRMDYES